MDESISNKIHLNFIFQLQNIGLWQWGIYVSLFIKNKIENIYMIKLLLTKNIEKVDEEMEKFLVDELKIPKIWIYEAKSIYAKYEFNFVDQVDYYFESHQFENSHHVLVDYLSPILIKNQNFKFLLEKLERFEKISSNVVSWEKKGKVYLNFIKIMKEFQTIKSSNNKTHWLDFYNQLTEVTEKLSNWNYLTKEEDYLFLERFSISFMSSEISQFLDVTKKCLQKLSGEEELDNFTNYYHANITKNLPIQENYRIQQINILISNFLNFNNNFEL
jgi:hypothetical protein